MQKYDFEAPIKLQMFFTNKAIYYVSSIKDNMDTANIATSSTSCNAAVMKRNHNQVTLLSDTAEPKLWTTFLN